MVADFEHTGDTGLDHGLKYRGQIKMLQSPAKIAAAMCPEIRHRAFETASQALQIVEREIA